MRTIGSRLQKIESWLDSFRLDVFTPVLPAKWVDDALRAAGRMGQRQRALPAPLTLWLVVAMAIYRKLSIRNVLGQIGNVLGLGSLWLNGETPTSASVVEARDRLGFRPLRLLFERFAAHLMQKYSEAMSYKGMPLMALDACTFKVPDSDQNRRRFGLPGSSRGRAAFPQVRALFLVSVRFHFILKALFAPYGRGEVSLAHRLKSSLPEGILVLLDRGFCATWFLAGILARRSHFVVRAPAHLRPRRITRLGRGDWLVEIEILRAARRRFPEAPRRLALREITIQRRGRWIRLVTSLCDKKVHAAQQIVDLYRERWEAEGLIDEIKTHQIGATTVNRPLIFRSMTTRRVLQEAYGLALAYNLVRALMAESAQRANLPPTRISFVDSLERIRVASYRMAGASPSAQRAVYDDLLESMSRSTLPERRERTNPREVCIKMSPYRLKKKKRAA